MIMTHMRGLITPLITTHEPPSKPQDADWQGLPLMSWPVSGRDTHHETRPEQSRERKGLRLLYRFLKGTARVRIRGYCLGLSGLGPHRFGI